MRSISNYFYKISGIYRRLCRYMAYMYRYDWLVTPYYTELIKPDKLLDGFNKVLTYLDKFEAKKFFGSPQGLRRGERSSHNRLYLYRRLPLFYRSGIDHKIATAFEQNIIGQNSASDKDN